MGKLIGIDLGTTSSCVAVMEGDLVLLDVTPHSLGIEAAGGAFAIIIEPNSTIPTRKSRTFTTVADNQTGVEIHVLEFGGGVPVRGKSLARLELTDTLPAPKGVAQIEVSFEIDVNGIVSVSAQDQAAGRSQSMTIRPSGGLSQQEVQRLAAETRVRETAKKNGR